MENVNQESQNTKMNIYFDHVIFAIANIYTKNTSLRERSMEM